jgi:transposase
MSAQGPTAEQLIVNITSLLLPKNGHRLCERPLQMSTGDRTILGRITKRGNRYLRMLFIQGARAILLRPASWAKHSFGSWLTAAARRMHRNVLAVALANKLARIAWTVLAQGRSYEARVEPRVESATA